jgi:hypothetical protein
MGNKHDEAIKAVANEKSNEHCTPALTTVRSVYIIVGGKLRNYTEFMGICLLEKSY